MSQLPDLHQNEAHPLHIITGHLSADPDVASLPAMAVTAHLYFVLIKARRTADRERILFWFNGGPGCSSFDGLMMETERMVRVVSKQLKEVGKIDQPAGTGFSYTSTDRYVHELDEASQQFIEFLRNFYIVFPEYKCMDVDIYRRRELCSTIYPIFLGPVLKSNLNVQLHGAAIGNRWIDARRQYPSFLDYAVKHSIIEENSENYEKGKKAVDECNAVLKNIEDELINVNVCEQVMGIVSEVRNRNIDGQLVVTIGHRQHPALLSFTVIGKGINFVFAKHGIVKQGERKLGSMKKPTITAKKGTDTSGDETTLHRPGDSFISISFFRMLP
ncbi:hypothetical protein EW146_g8688 [Bondarzewia mesenterica]|uniref:Pheromone-processing carboxypeptidase KEX1 n=1 Tax=Bondarzewia mesenterica TaxID=1095465 RepID=A0A4S4LCD1_9AGAM|nr:hypothetical protein EW146_g8688 [Bondarzewia mesenterica]